MLVALLGSPARAEPKAAAGGTAEKPILTGAVSSIDRVYDDLKFVFQLAGDDKGYKTFKETIEVFTEGVETNKPSGWRVYLSPDGLHTVASVPVKDEAAFKTFLRNLWDLDVKTAPPPAPSLTSHVQRPILEKVRSLKLQSNERIVFGLSEGFLRYESGYVHIGLTLEDVRAAKGGISAEHAKGETVSLHIDGEAATPAQRRKAFDDTRQKIISAMKKAENQTAAEFALAQAVADLQFSKYELFFADSSRVDLGWTTSHATKKSVLTAHVTGAKGTSLAKGIEQMGQISDDFAGVSQQGTVMSSTINFSNDETITKALKSVVQNARQVATDQINKDEHLNAEQKSIDKQFVELVSDLVGDVAAMPFFNGFGRTWANSDGSLTTVGAVKVADGAKYRELVQKFKSQERVGRQSGNGGVEIHKITVAKWQKEVPEFFEKDGAVYLGTSDKAVWYALGEKSLERLEQAIQEAGSAKASKDVAAIDFHAELMPLAKVWERFRSRHPLSTPGTPTNAKKKEVAATETNSTKVTKKTGGSDRANESSGQEGTAKKSKASDKKESVARAKASVNDLDLPKLAAQAFQHGHDTFSVTLKRNGEDAELVVKSEEGLLRFLGLALAKFTKDNLEEE